MKKIMTIIVGLFLCFGFKYCLFAQEGTELTWDKKDAYYPNPILFVHGLSANADIWSFILSKEEFYLKFFKRLPDSSVTSIYYRNGTPFGIEDKQSALQYPYLQTFNYGNYKFKQTFLGAKANAFDKDKPANLNELLPEANGNIFTLEDALSLVYDAYGQKDAILVTHSFGGLVLRYYLSEQERMGKPSYVRRLLTLSTPHTGSYMANLVEKFDGSLWKWMKAHIFSPVSAIEHDAFMLIMQAGDLVGNEGMTSLYNYRRYAAWQGVKDSQIGSQLLKDINGKTYPEIEYVHTPFKMDWLNLTRLMHVFTTYISEQSLVSEVRKIRGADGIVSLSSQEGEGVYGNAKPVINYNDKGKPWAGDHVAAFVHGEKAVLKGIDGIDGFLDSYSKDNSDTPGIAKCEAVVKILKNGVEETETSVMKSLLEIKLKELKAEDLEVMKIKADNFEFKLKFLSGIKDNGDKEIGQEYLPASLSGKVSYYGSSKFINDADEFEGLEDKFTELYSFDDVSDDDPLRQCYVGKLTDSAAEEEKQYASFETKEFQKIKKEQLAGNKYLYFKIEVTNAAGLVGYQYFVFKVSYDILKTEVRPIYDESGGYVKGVTGYKVTIHNDSSAVLSEGELKIYAENKRGEKRCIRTIEKVKANKLDFLKTEAGDKLTIELVKENCDKPINAPQNNAKLYADEKVYGIFEFKGLINEEEGIGTGTCPMINIMPLLWGLGERYKKSMGTEAIWIKYTADNQQETFTEYPTMEAYDDGEIGYRIVKDMRNIINNRLLHMYWDSEELNTFKNVIISESTGNDDAILESEAWTRTEIQVKQTGILLSDIIEIEAWLKKFKEVSLPMEYINPNAPNLVKKGVGESSSWNAARSSAFTMANETPAIADSDEPGFSTPRSNHSDGSARFFGQSELFEGSEGDIYRVTVKMGRAYVKINTAPLLGMIYKPVDGLGLPSIPVPIPLVDNRLNIYMRAWDEYTPAIVPGATWNVPDYDLYATHREYGGILNNGWDLDPQVDPQTGQVCEAAGKISLISSSNRFNQDRSFYRIWTNIATNDITDLFKYINLEGYTYLMLSPQNADGFNNRQDITYDQRIWAQIQACMTYKPKFIYYKD